MKTKIIYTLVSDESDYYYEQALMSLHSLRLHHPSLVVVVLVVDETTNNTLKGKREEIKKYVNNIVSVHVPDEYDKKQSSRYLKTNLRQYVRGDYLFIDCDTVICKSLSEIDKIEASIAMVSDINGDLPLKDETIIKRCETAGFGNLEGKPYFNSGVIYAKDTPEVHHFYEEWHNNWKVSVNKSIVFDQLALCKTNADNGYLINELPAIWNCQFKYTQGYKYLRNAIIMHYFNPNDTNNWSLPTDMVFETIKKNGSINTTTDYLIRHPKNVLYTVMTINKEHSYRYFNSEMTYIYYCQPRLYKMILSGSKMFSRIVSHFSYTKREN